MHSLMYQTKTLRKKYVPDLQKLQGICSRNYGLLVRLLPLEYQQGQTWSVAVSNSLNFSLAVETKTPYTETMRLVQNNPTIPKFMATEIEFRVYHDAQMVEVLSFQKQSRLRQKYSYPNPMLHQKDEKLQVNALLKDWLNLVTKQQEQQTGESRLLSSI